MCADFLTEILPNVNQKVLLRISPQRNYQDIDHEIWAGYTEGALYELGIQGV